MFSKLSECDTEYDTQKYCKIEKIVICKVQFDSFISLYYDVGRF